MNVSSEAFRAGSESAGSLRILHMFRAPLGGLFRHVCDLAAEQARTGHHVGVVCDAARGEAAAEAQLTRLAEVCSLGLLRVPMTRAPGMGDIAAVQAIARHAARLAPQVVHGHGAKGGAYARLIRRPDGCVAIYTPHGGTLHYAWHRPSGALFLALEFLLRGRGDGILFESEFSAAAYARKIGAVRCPARVVPNGVAEADFAPVAEAPCPYDLVFIGELRRLKGLGALIEATALLAAERDIRLGIAGTGADEPQFRALVAARGLGARVDFLGHQPARAMFARGRIVVVPSLAESFPYIVLEAAAAGRPLVATNVGGIPEIFGPLAHRLVDAGDVQALAQAIASALDAPGEAEAEAMMLREHARRSFSVRRMAAAITSFYRELHARPHYPACELPPLKPAETTSV